MNFSEDVFASGIIRKARSNNGDELISQEFKEILTKNAISYELMHLMYHIKMEQQNVDEEQFLRWGDCF